MDNHIIPECYLDTILAECLVQPDNSKNGYNHQKGCSTVTSTMQTSKKLKDNFAVGILDEDKKQTPYLNELSLVTEKSGLKLYKHPSKHHYLILHPPLEQWILDEANAFGINLSNYDLPSERKTLQDQAKTTKSRYDPRFNKLFRDLKSSESFDRLANWLSYLKQHPYNACLEHLKTL